jgi:hypothetical protein
MPPPSIGRIRSLALAGAAQIWAFVTPYVTPSPFRCAFSSLIISDKPLILNTERVKGIEPSSSAWKAVALPLSYTRARESPHASPPSPRLRRLAFAIGRLASRSAAGAKAGGGGRTRTYEGVSQRIYSPPPLPLGTLPRTSHPRGCMVSSGYGERVGRCQPRQIRPRQR